MRHIMILFALAFFVMTGVTNAQGWVAQTSGTTYDLYSVCFVNENTGWAVGYAGLSIPKTTDGGTTWVDIDIHASIGISCRSVYFIDSNTGWIAADMGIYKTTDGGTTWTHPYTGYDIVHSIYFINNTTGWAIGEGGKALRTTDGGSTWLTSSTATSTDKWYSLHFVDNMTGWAVGWYGGIDKTTDGGATWTQQTFDLMTNLRSVFFIDQNTGWTVGDGGSIKKTTNGGTEWKNVTGVTSVDLQSVFFTDNNNGWIVGGNPYISPKQVVFHTTDGGANWTSESTPDAAKCLYSVYFVNSTTGWAVGAGGTIFKTTNGGTAVERIPSTMPNEFALLQNYPNPFNPTTMIEFTVPKNGKAVLKVFDMLGREVATLFDGEVKAGITQKVVFDAANLTSGIYLSKLQFASQVLTKKMLLVR